MKNRSLFYAALFFGIIILDRVSKWCVLTFLSSSYRITSFLELTKTMNRGISWGFFNSAPEYAYWIITFVIGAFCMMLICYAWQRAARGFSIVGEMLIIAGGLSNFIDRIMYSGVVDFILVSFGQWSWPVFNVADAAIVIGAGLMIIESFGGKSK
ncbi:MAG TPA: signal peptidase II [Candidatus Babeliales bacterium]|nr:signal peptidase II [Candidatus Babeliales bacterium]